MEEEKLLCPRCKRPVLFGNRFCEHCGCELTVLYEHDEKAARGGEADRLHSRSEGRTEYRRTIRFHGFSPDPDNPSDTASEKTYRGGAGGTLKMTGDLANPAEAENPVPEEADNRSMEPAGDPASSPTGNNPDSYFHMPE